MATTATSAMNTLTNGQQKALDAIVSAQAPVVAYVRKAVDFVESTIPELPTRELGEKLPSLKQFVDNQFLFATRMLETNHTFVLELLEATKPVAEKVIVQKSAVGIRKVAKTPARKRSTTPVAA
ncbi:MAG: hypothetical protein WCK41_09280 [Actinomycetes bacterium]